MAQHFNGGATLPDPIEMLLGDRRYWHFANGRILPVIAGGDGSGDGGGDGGDSGGGDGDGGNSSDGDKGKGGDPPADADKDTTDPKVKAARDESIAERQKRQKVEADLADANKRLKEIEDKDKSDLQKATDDAKVSTEKAEKLERETRELRSQIAFADAGRKAGALYPEKLFKMVDESDVERAEDGAVTNAEKVVGKLRESMPELFGKSKPAGSADQGPRKTKSSDEVKPGSDRLRHAYDNAGKT